MGPAEDMVTLSGPAVLCGGGGGGGCHPHDEMQMEK